MDLELTKQQQDFRDQVCRLLCENAVQQEAAASYRLPRTMPNRDCWRSIDDSANAAGWRRTGNRSTAASVPPWWRRRSSPRK